MINGLRKLRANFGRPIVASEADSSRIQLRSVDLTRVTLTTAICTTIIVEVFIHYGVMIAAYGAILLSSIASIFSGGHRRPVRLADYHLVTKRAFALLGSAAAIFIVIDICTSVLIWISAASNTLDFATPVLFDLNRILRMTWMWESGSPHDYYQLKGREDLYPMLVALKSALRITDSFELFLTAGLYHYISIAHGESLVPLFIYSRKPDLRIKHVIAATIMLAGPVLIIYGLFGIRLSEDTIVYSPDFTYKIFIVNVVGSCVHEFMTIFFFIGLALLLPGKHWMRL